MRLSLNAEGKKPVSEGLGEGLCSKMPGVGKAKLSKVKALSASFSRLPRKKQREAPCGAQGGRNG